MRVAPSRCALWIFAAAAICLSAPARAHAQYAIVVNPGSRVADLTLDQLKRLFLGQSTTLPGGKPADVAFLAPERATFATSVLGYPDQAVRRRWIGMVFRGEQTTPPQDLATAEMVKRFVVEHPNGIAFLRAADADASVKVLGIDGRKPSDAGYPVR